METPTGQPGHAAEAAHISRRYDLDLEQLRERILAMGIHEIPWKSANSSTQARTVFTCTLHSHPLDFVSPATIFCP